MTDRAWNLTHEGNPATTEDISLGANRIADDKETTRMRLQTEHDVGLIDSGYSDDGRHSPGSARAFYGATAPTTLRRPDDTNLTLAEMPVSAGGPDHTASLGVNDKGRLWLDETATPAAELKWYDGTAWSPLVSSNWRLAQRRNLLLNGGFEVWQRGTAATAFTSYSFLADRWGLTGAGAGTPTQERSNVPGTMAGPPVSRYCMKIFGSVGTTTVQLSQRIESMYYPIYRGRISVQCRVFYDHDNDGVESGTIALTLRMRTPDVTDDDWSASTEVFSSPAAAVTDDRVTWTNIDTTGFANITRGLQVTIEFPNTSLDAATKVVYITDIQVEAATAVTPFEFSPLGPELELCKRYYTKTYNQGSAPASAVAASLRTVAEAGTFTDVQWVFSVTMCKVPTVTVYNHVTGAVGTWQDFGGTNRATTASTASDHSVSFISTGVVAGTSIGGHATADAEL